MTNKTQLDTLDREWVDRSYDLIIHGLTPGEINSDLLHDYLGEPPHRNHFGVLLAKLKRAGKLAYLGHIRSKRKSANGRNISNWRLL